MGLELRAVQTDDEWSAMHAIRRAVLFAPGRLPVDYDDNHPDDRVEGNVPHILMLDEEPIGTARLDFRKNFAIVRLFAILPAHQRDGNGTLIDQMLSEKAWELGASQLRLNASPDAVGFYEKCGWRQESWDPEELIGIARDAVQMVKDLG
jgi:GNAT superfamily N-acetyltransferase